MRWLWAMFCVACGGSSTPAVTDGSIDGPADDAAMTDASLDALVGSITVQAFDQHGPQPHLPLAGATVKFIAPDGTTQTMTTNSLGIATAVAPPNTTVMLFQQGEGNFPLIKAFVGANPGDEIAIGKYTREAFVDIGDVTFDLPTVAGAEQYKLVVACSRRIGATDDVITMRATDCAAHQAATAVGWAEGSGGVVIGGASVMTGLNLAALVGTTVTMPAYAAQTSVSGTMVNVPAAATDVAWSAYYYANNDRMLLAAAGSTAATATVPVFDVGERSVSALVFRLPGYERNYYYESHPTKIATVAVDGAGMIRPFKDLAYQFVTNSVTWNEPAVGAAPTIVSLRLSDNVNGITKMVLQVHAPYDPSRKIVLPPLPPNLTIGVNDTVNVTARFHSMDGKSYSDMLEIVDSSALVEYDPTFTGKLWKVW